MNSNREGYQHAAIWHIESLALSLGVPVKELKAVANIADTLYREIPQKKKDGTRRLCYDAAPRLKAIQEQIKLRIFRNVKFPSYVMGGIGDKQHPRDYLANAACHSGARLLINEDIANFFSSVRTEVVLDIWKNYFGFSAEVSRILTSLTTLKGVLPQGAKTSSYLANLAFWRLEPDFVKRLASSGIRYTRWVDDATLSSPSNLSNNTLHAVLADYFGMIRKTGLSVKRQKHRLSRAGSQMEVTGAMVGDTLPSLGRKKKSRARAMVSRCERLATLSPTSTETSQALTTAAGLVGQLGRAHPGEAAKLRERLASVKLARSREKQKTVEGVCGKQV